MAESVRTIPPGFNFERTAPAISAREGRLHGSLLILTTMTTTLACNILVAPEVQTPEPPLATPLDYLLYLPLSYLYWGAELFKYAMANPHLIAEGATFSACLLPL